MADRTEEAIQFAGEAEKRLETMLDMFCGDFPLRKLDRMRTELEAMIACDPEGGDPFHRRLLDAVEANRRQRGRRL